MNITNHIHEFRETARHLWNSSLRNNASWDSVEAFNKIGKLLFEEQILNKLEINAPPILLDSSSTIPIQEYNIYMEGKGKLPLHVNRDLPASGYWDYELDWIPPEEKPIIKPICICDFDVLNWRKLEFYRVQIIECPSHPEINGRDALIGCDYVEIEVST